MSGEAEAAGDSAELVEVVARAMESYHDRVSQAYAVGDVPPSHWNDLARTAIKAIPAGLGDAARARLK